MTITIKAILIKLQNGEMYRFGDTVDAREFIQFGTFQEAQILYHIDGQMVNATFDDYYALVEELS